MWSQVKRRMTFQTTLKYCSCSFLESGNYCERFEPRSHFKSRLSLIVRVNVVLNRTVVVDSDWRFHNLCGCHLQSQSEFYHVDSWWYYTLVIDLIGQLRRDVINNQSIIPSTEVIQLTLWLWRWQPHRLSKRQSLSTTTVPFRTTFTRTIKLNLLLVITVRRSSPMPITFEILSKFRGFNTCSF